MKSLAANLFLVSLFRISISVFILNPSTNIVVEPLAEPIIHGEKAIHAIVPAPEGSNVGDIIVIKNEFQNYEIIQMGSAGYSSHHNSPNIDSNQYHSNDAFVGSQNYNTSGPN